MNRFPIYLSDPPVSSPVTCEEEVRLRMFIDCVLQIARTNQYSTDVTLQWLDRAWEVQKQLWQLRSEQILK